MDGKKVHMVNTADSMNARLADRPVIANGDAHHGHDASADNLTDRNAHELLLTKDARKVLSRRHGLLFLVRHKGLTS